MNLLNTVRAETVKLFTTRSVWWTSALFVLLSFGISLLLTVTPQQPLGLFVFQIQPYTVVYGIPSIGLPVLIVQAVMVVTTEYRYRIQATAYLASPRRWTVPVAKLLVYGIYAAALTFLTALLCLVVAKVRVGDDALIYSMGDPDVLRILWVLPLATFLVVCFSQGVGLLLRHTAGAVALLLAWILALEDIVAFLPKIGELVGDWLPFRHLNNFIAGGGPAGGATGLDWTQGASLAYFALWAVGLFLIGVGVLYKRDV